MKGQKPEAVAFTSSLDHIINERSGDTRTLRLGITVAVLAHIVLFIANWPSLARSAPKGPEKQPPVVVLRQFKYTIPPTPPPRAPVKRPPKMVPVPDPDPLDEEPLRHAELWLPDDFDPNIVVSGDFEAPEPPPEIVPEVVRVGFEVTPPRRIVMVQPVYPESARRARIEGTVILNLTIGISGRVEAIEVEQGLPLGLSEAAVEAARQWVFEPSLYKGRPTAIQYVLTVNFQLH